ncbi:MAG TPA: inorganic phosphate transporter [Pseudobacteroides sp.]|uniref:inorganic phosphate transporter n=1 Tax=Pseudobacteroides sp. TaxID=1968840 RepID=UPI002F95485B
MLSLAIIVVILALSFDFINGFHDTANSIATSVSTRVLSPRTAIFMAAVLNIAGALVSTRVAKTVSKEIINDDMIKVVGGDKGVMYVVIASLAAAIIWNLVTWYFGIPSSSSHALFGGMIGSSVAYIGSMAVLKWYEAPQAGHFFFQAKGILFKIIIPLFTSPLIGFLLGFLVMKFLYLILRKFTQHSVNTIFSKLQIASAGIMAFAHGGNDAQKSMGIITLALIAADMNGGSKDVTLPVVIACALAMGIGTSLGGWRIIKTMGVNMIRLAPINGFAAETGAAIVIETMTRLGAPVSTTHIISTSIMGVGAAKRLSAVRWALARSILGAWVLTIPITAILGAVIVLGCKIVLGI